MSSLWNKFFSNEKNLTTRLSEVQASITSYVRDQIRQRAIHRQLLEYRIVVPPLAIVTPNGPLQGILVKSELMSLDLNELKNHDTLRPRLTELTDRFGATIDQTLLDPFRLPATWAITVNDFDSFCRALSNFKEAYGVKATKVLAPVSMVKDFNDAWLPIVPVVGWRDDYHWLLAADCGMLLTTSDPKVIIKQIADRLELYIEQEIAMELKNPLPLQPIRIK
jgi:hypothetical protein